LASAGASVLILLPMPALFQFVWMPVCLTAAGFFAVYLYKRRTGVDLSTRKGAKMGWITGMFCFLIATVFYTVTMVMLASRGGLGTFYREQLAAQGDGGVEMEELLRILDTPSGTATLLVFSLFVLFFFSTLLPVLGGAMGAKVLEKG
jgi:hypothetical protein